MERVVSVGVLPDWSLDVVFFDGVRGVVGVKDRLFGPVFEPLEDATRFAQASIDKFGAIWLAQWGRCRTGRAVGRPQSHTLRGLRSEAESSTPPADPVLQFNSR